MIASVIGILLLACWSLPAQEVKAVVNAASFGTAVAPGSIVSLFGTGLQGAAVEVNGRNAPVFFSSDTQINAQLPVETAPGAAVVKVGTATLPITAATAAPGIFKLSGDRAAIRPVRVGEYATIYLTGQGEVAPPVATGRTAPAEPLSHVRAEVTVTVGGARAEVQFAGLAPGFVGLMQLNLLVPALAAGEHAVVVTIAGVASNPALIAVELPPAEWRSQIKVAPGGDAVHAGRSYASSTSLRVEWSAPDVSVHHYQMNGNEQRSSVHSDAPGDAKEAVLRGLKAGTEYTVDLRACLDAECARSIAASDSGRGATSNEYWAIQGSGNSFATASHLVSDGNVGSYAMRYGKWAGPELDGKIQLYYNPLQGSEKGVKIAELAAARADSIEAASSFRAISGFGLLHPCVPVPGNPPTPPAECTGSRSLVTNLALFQAVPLPPEQGGKVRLYFEAAGGDGRTRILYLDSQDGYAGRDFHPGASTRCNTLADYSPGGACEPKLAIGVDLDGASGNPNVRNARQFKIAYPTLDSWVWDMKPGTLMWFTTEWADRRCSAYGYNIAYAVWNGSGWVVQYRPDGCPKLIEGAQAPAPVHLGGGRYKVYFNLHPAPGGPTNPQRALKPMRMLYADPETAGDPTVTDFEDWEPLASARQIHYLWSTGTPLTEEEESRLDDYVIFAPTADSTRLIMYSNMSAGGAQGLPFIGSAVLVNP